MQKRTRERKTVTDRGRRGRTSDMVPAPPPAYAGRVGGGGQSRGHGNRKNSYHVRFGKHCAMSGFTQITIFGLSSTSHLELCPMLIGGACPQHVVALPKNLQKNCKKHTKKLPIRDFPSRVDKSRIDANRVFRNFSVCFS